MALTLAEMEERLDQQDWARRVQLSVSRMRSIVTVALMLVAVTFITYLVSPRHAQLLVVAGSCLILAVAAAVYPVFYRRGRIKAGIYVALVPFLLVVAISFFVLPALGLGAVFGFLVIVNMSTELLGTRDSLPLAAMALALLIADALATQLVSLPFPPLEKTPAIAIGVAFVAITGVGALMTTRGIVRRQVELFRRAQRSAWEVEQRASAEQQQRVYLQATVQHYLDSITQVAGGNLAVRISLDSAGGDADDPLLVLGRCLNDSFASLQGLTSRVRDAASNLESVSAGILGVTSLQASGVAQQSVAINEVTTTIDQVRAIAGQTADWARGVGDSAGETAAASSAGRVAVDQTIAGMIQLREKVEIISASILTLAEQAQAIGEIIATVSDLAAQSNLLALNAAVEAARAGEAGRGFTVVAGEVRRLAEQSRAATVQVRDILIEVQRGINAAVGATEEGMQGAERSVRLAGQAGDAIRTLTDGIQESAGTIARITAAADQQLAGVEQIAAAMHDIHRVTSRTTAGARQSEQAAQALSQLAAQLREAIAQYRL